MGQRGMNQSNFQMLNKNAKRMDKYVILTRAVVSFEYFLHCSFPFSTRKGQTVKNHWKRQQNLRSQKNLTQVKNRDASVTVKNDWVMIEEIDFARFSKLSLPNVKEPEDL